MYANQTNVSITILSTINYAGAGIAAHFVGAAVEIAAIPLLQNLPHGNLIKVPLAKVLHETAECFISASSIISIKNTDSVWESIKYITRPMWNSPIETIFAGITSYGLELWAIKVFSLYSCNHHNHHHNHHHGHRVGLISTDNLIKGLASATGSLIGSYGYDKIVEYAAQLRGCVTESFLTQINVNTLTAIDKSNTGFFSAKERQEIPLYTTLKDLINSGTSIDALIVSKSSAELRAALLKQDGHGNSLLHWAVHSDNAGTIAKLMDCAQSLPGLLLEMFMIKDNVGNIPLLLALFREKIDAINLLLDKTLESAELFGALTVENKSGVSALEKIISNKMGGLLARIIKKADDLGKLSYVANFENSDGQSILELAKDSGSIDIEAQIAALPSSVIEDGVYTFDTNELHAHDFLNVTPAHDEL